MNEQKILLRRTMTKKEYAKHVRCNRNTTNINTGTRTMKSARDYNRQSIHMECQKLVKEA